jgi:hypothetical protein
MLEDVLAFHERLTECVGAEVPVPVKFSVVVPGWALLVKVSTALTAPATCGLKVTVNEVLLPACIVAGRESPPTLKTELFVLAAVTVTLAPLAVKLPDDVPLLPATTFPSPNVVGETVSWPTAVTPVPESGTLSVGSVAVDVIATLPVTSPADEGVKETLKVALCPAFRANGVVIPLTLNPVPVALT